MKSPSKIQLTALAVYTLIAGFFAWLLQPLISARRIRLGAVALGNIVALTFEGGRETLTVDPGNGVVTLPTATKWLLWQRGTSGVYYAMLTAGGGTSAAFPLGPSPDAPYQAGDLITVNRLGGIVGTTFGVAAGAITVDHLLGAAAAGQVVDLQTATTTYTAWVVGRATATVAAAGMQISYVPCAPYLVTTTGGTLTLPTNPL